MLTPNERRIHTDYENRRELAEVGLTAEVTCTICSGEAGEDAISLMGLAYCTDCGADEAFRLRGDGAEWAELTRLDQVEILEVCETQARLERLHLIKKAVR